MNKSVLTAVAVAATLTLMTSCGKADKSGSTGGDAGEQAMEQIDSLHPWTAFQPLKTDYKAGDHAFGCTNLETVGDENNRYLFGGLRVLEVNDTACECNRIDFDKATRGFEVPKSLMIPIPASATAKAGDMVLFAGMGTRMQLGRVLNDQGTKVLPMLDSYFKLKDGKMVPFGPGSGEFELKPGTFLPLKPGEWMAGAPVVFGPDNMFGVIINMSGDKLLVWQVRNKSVLHCVDKAQCQLLDLQPDYKAGDKVEIARVFEKFAGNYVVQQCDAAQGLVSVVTEGAGTGATPQVMPVTAVRKK